jgi:hypothetical protein
MIREFKREDIGQYSMETGKWSCLLCEWVGISLMEHYQQSNHPAITYSYIRWPDKSDVAKAMYESKCRVIR